MTEERITFEIARLAKEKGFNEEGEHYYLSPDYDILMGLNRTGYNMYPTKKNSDGKGLIIVVTQSLLQHWLREVHDIYLVILPIIEGWNYIILNTSNIEAIEEGDDTIMDYIDSLDYSVYEEALEAGLLEGLKLIKND